MTRLPLFALLPLCFAATASAQAPAQYVVQLSNFAYAPHPIVLAAGKPVTMTFVNRSGSGHDFTARAFFQHAAITAGAAPGGQIELRPNEAKTITLVPRAGTYEAHCTHFFHTQMGMSDVIIVR